MAALEEVVASHRRRSHFAINQRRGLGPAAPWESSQASGLTAPKVGSMLEGEQHKAEQPIESIDSIVDG